jgi:predicted anti-sigma-YlaC factor YlaD
MSETEYRNGACAEYEVLLEDLLDGDLGDCEAKKLAEHMNRCSGCRSALEVAKQSGALLRIASPTPDLGPGFSRIVMARIHDVQENAAAERRTFWRSLVSLEWRFAATAAVVLAALLTYDARWHRTLQSEIRMGQQAETRDLFSPNARIVPVTQDDVLIMIAEENHGNH